MSRRHGDIEYICTHLGDDYDRFLGSIVPPIFQSSLFTRKSGSSGYTYTRVSNPTTEIAERKLASLEGGEAALCFASGMAAISAGIMHHLKAGSHVVAPSAIYLPTRVLLSDYLSRFGVSTSFVDGGTASFEAAIRDETALIYLESPGSLVFSMQDLRGIARIARERRIPTMIDNSWATPVFQRPLALGIDMVAHSASKYLGGHSDIVGGVLVGSSEAMQAIRHSERGLFGGIMDPWLSWLLTRSLRTLPIRMRAHHENALKVATFLESHRRVARVIHPGLKSHPDYDVGAGQMSGYSGLFSFVPVGEPGAVHAAMKQLEYFEEGPSWGGFESLFSTPGLSNDPEHLRRLGVPKGLVRLSIGLEDPEDLLSDLDRVLEML